MADIREFRAVGPCLGWVYAPAATMTAAGVEVAARLPRPPAAAVLPGEGRFPGPVPGNGHAGRAAAGIACLDVLAAQLRARGWSAYLTEPAGRLASLFVQDPHGHAGCGDIIAAPDTATGHWWYWFSWAERIAPAHAPAAAADAIISAFQRPADEPPEPAAAAGGQPPPPPAGSPSTGLDQHPGTSCGFAPLTTPHCGPHRTRRSQ